MSLGVLRPGCSAETEISVRNPSPHRVVIKHIETSCPCLSVKQESINIDAKESATFTVKFDSGHDPDFRGRLSIEIIGRDGGENIIFRSRANLEVRARSIEG